MVAPETVATGWVSDPDLEPVALRPATGMLTDNVRVVGVFSWSEDVQLMSTRPQPSTKHMAIRANRGAGARRPNMPMLPNATRRTTDHPAQAEALRVPGSAAAGAALVAVIGLLISRVTSSWVTVCGSRSCGGLISRVSVSTSPCTC